MSWAESYNSENDSKVVPPKGFYDPYPCIHAEDNSDQNQRLEEGSDANDTMSPAPATVIHIDRTEESGVTPRGPVRSSALYEGSGMQEIPRRPKSMIAEGFVEESRCRRRRRRGR